MFVLYLNIKLTFTSYNGHMKACTKCKEVKHLNEFYVKESASGRLHAQCKDCYREHRKSYHPEHYRKYGDEYRARARRRHATIRKLLHTKMLAYLSNRKCVICGEDDIRTLEFDHIYPPSKKFSISKGVTNGLRWEVILDEIHKCRILCANCHKKHTALQKNWYRI